MSLQTGQELAPEIFIVNRQKLTTYANASGDQNPIHHNEEFAKSVGLPDVIAHGMFTMGVTATYLSKINGSSAVKEFSAKFIKPVVVPANRDVEIKVSGVIGEISEGLAKIDLTVICDEIKVLGSAKATVQVK